MDAKESEVLELMKKIFQKPSISIATPLEDFAVDSMDVAEFLAVLQKKHKFSVNPEKFFKMKTAGDVINYICRLK